MAGHRDAQSHALCKLNPNNCKGNSSWDLMLLGGTRCFEQAMDWFLLVEGEYKLYHSVWEPPIMCVAWKILRSLGCYVDNESIPLKILFISISKSSSGTSTNPCFPLRRAYHLLLCWVIILLLKSTSWRAPLSFVVITVSLHWVWLGWIYFTMNYNVLSILDL